MKSIRIERGSCCIQLDIGTEIEMKFEKDNLQQLTLFEEIVKFDFFYRKKSVSVPQKFPRMIGKKMKQSVIEGKKRKRIDSTG